jgi:hypothetical protein
MRLRVVKRDWVATGRIDFATNLDNNDDPSQPAHYRKYLKENSLIKSVYDGEILPPEAKHKSA